MLARVMNTPGQFRRMQTEQQSNALSAAMVDLLDAVVRTIFDRIQAAVRKASSRFMLAVLLQLVDAANALVGRFNIGRNTTLDQIVDRMDASFGDTFWIRRVRCDIGCLGGGNLLAGQHGDRRQGQDSKSLHGHDLPLFSAIGVGNETERVVRKRSSPGRDSLVVVPKMQVFVQGLAKKMRKNRREQSVGWFAAVESLRLAINRREA